MKQAIYYIKNDEVNKIVSVANYNDVNLVINEMALERIRCNIEDARLYVLIDGIEFELLR